MRVREEPACRKLNEGTSKSSTRVIKELETKEREKKYRACLERGKISMFLRFSCEIELFPVKFLWDSCGIPAFQTGP